MRLFLVSSAVLLSSMVLVAAQGSRRAPSFTLPDANGQEHDLVDYRGRVVLVEFMRTNCPHCAEFSHLLGEVQAHYGNKVAILAIATNPDNASTVRDFAKTNKTTYPILVDCGQVAYSYILPNNLRPSVSIPHLYVVDQAGIIRGDYEAAPETNGIFHGKQLYTEIDKLLAEKK